MLKISKNASALLSQLLCVACFVVLLVITVFLPGILGEMLSGFGKPDYLYTPSLIILYVALVPAYAAVVTLFLMLRRVRRGSVFTAANVAGIRLISWCCLCEGVIFFSLGFYYITGFAVAFVFVFAGVAARVFKNIVEEAVSLKNENDFTI